MGVLFVKFFAKLKFIILPVLKFLPVILKTGGTMILTIWVYAMIWKHLKWQLQAHLQSV